MPQRFLRPGITTSRRWNSLDWDAQSFYIRLLTVVDDYGRYDADHDLLKAFCFPLRQDVTVQAIENMCQQLLASHLAEFYADSEGKPLLQLTKWQERARSGSKYPGPNDNSCKQLTTIANKCCEMLPPSPSPSSSPSPTPSGNGCAAFEKFWSVYPKQVKRFDTEHAFVEVRGQDRLDEIIAAVLAQKKTDRWKADGGRYIPDPNNWLRDGRWADNVAQMNKKQEKGNL